MSQRLKQQVRLFQRMLKVATWLNGKLDRLSKCARVSAMKLQTNLIGRRVRCTPTVGEPIVGECVGVLLNTSGPKYWEVVFFVREDVTNEFRKCCGMAKVEVLS